MFKALKEKISAQPKKRIVMWIGLQVVEFIVLLVILGTLAMRAPDTFMKMFPAAREMQKERARRPYIADINRIHDYDGDGIEPVRFDTSGFFEDEFDAVDREEVKMNKGHLKWAWIGITRETSDNASTEYFKQLLSDCISPDYSPDECWERLDPVFAEIREKTAKYDLHTQVRVRFIQEDATFRGIQVEAQSKELDETGEKEVHINRFAFASK